MNTADYILFEQLFNGKPLFSSQQELVNQLLQNTNSGFYTPNDSPEYFRGTNRLKTYISQLLSDNVIRSLTPIFKNSLGIIIKERLVNTIHDPIEITEKVIFSLTKKNKRQNVESTNTVIFDSKKELYKDVFNAHYILVIAAHPFDIDNSDSRESLQKLLIQDLLDTFLSPEKQLKHYRFNFPLQQMCELFWLAVKKSLEKALTKFVNSKTFFDSLYLRSLITKLTYEEVALNEDINGEKISKVSIDILNYLNINKYLLVFLMDQPIYTAPLIVIDPNDLRNCKAYFILENESGKATVNNLPFQDIVTWKLFVFDKIKTQGLGRQINFKSNFHSW